MAEKSKTPAIRFKGFTDAWEQRKLGDVATAITRTDSESIAPVMMISAASGFINQSEKYSSDNAGQSLAKYILLKKGELAYNHGASKYRQYGSCFDLKVDEARIPFVYHCFEVGYNNPDFIARELNDPRIDKQLRRLVSSGARMDGLLNISFEAYKTVTISVPQNEEQDKISVFLLELDKLSTLHQRKYNKLQNVKKAMLEKMFPKNGSNVPEIRFVGFTDAWEQRKLGEMTCLITKGTTPVDKSGNGNINFVKIENIDSASGEISITSKISEEEHNGYLKRSQLQEDDILFSIAGTLGRVTSVNKGILPANTNQALAIIRLKTGCLNYIKTYLKGKAVADFVKKNPTIGAQPNLSLEQVGNLVIDLPSFEEQQEIGAFFNNLDNLITLHQRKLDKLQNMKKACLEKMFV